MGRDYWSQRQGEKLLSVLSKGEVSSKYIGDRLFASSKRLDNKIDDLFEKYKTKNGLTQKEAEQLIAGIKNYDYDELYKQLKASSSSDEKKEIIKKLEAGAYGNRIARLNDLNRQVDQIARQNYNMTNKTVTSTLKDTINEAYYRNVYNMQSYLGNEINFSYIDPKMVDKLLYSNWSGEFFSKRIWNNTQAVAESVKRELMMGYLTGMTNNEMSKAISQRFQVSAFNARRLIATEQAAMVSEVDQENFKQFGIEYERFTAVLDDRTSEICEEMDGTIVKVGEGVEGENIPPMHPFCRSYMEPLFDGDPELLKYNSKGKTIPFSSKKTSFNEWYKKAINIKTNAGAYNNFNDPWYKKRNAFAETYYKEITNRNKKNEINSVANNSGFDYTDIEKVYDHIFIDKHKFKNGLIKKFDPSYDMAESWQRLREGKNILDHDITMINHELLESKIMKEHPEFVYEEAHELANEKYDYSLELSLWKKGKK